MLSPKSIHGRRLASCLALTLAAAACGSSSTSTTSEAADTTTQNTATQDTATEEVTTQDTATEGDGSATQLAGVEAAAWGDNVTITVGDDSFRFESDGLPNHELPDQFLVPITGNMPPFDGDNISDEFEIADTDGLIVASPLDVEITLNPVYSEEVTLTDLSTIGVMVSGAPLFNDYEDQSREFVAVDDNISLDGVYFIDSCNGHPLATGDSYHYHGVPYCITDTVDVEGEHSTIIGVLLDGFPIYGPNDVDGVSLTNDDLDECSGHVGPTPEYPEGIYHYHLTDDSAPYSIDCFHGEIEYGGTQGGGGQDGGQDGGQAGGQAGPPDFTEAAEALGVSAADLEAALGQPPFDLDAAAEALGISAEDLEAALPQPGA